MYCTGTVHYIVQLLIFNNSRTYSTSMGNFYISMQKMYSMSYLRTFVHNEAHILYLDPIKPFLIEETLVNRDSKGSRPARVLIQLEIGRQRWHSPNLIVNILASRDYHGIFKSLSGNHDHIFM